MVIMSPEIDLVIGTYTNSFESILRFLLSLSSLVLFIRAVVPGAVVNVILALGSRLITNPCST